MSIVCNISSLISTDSCTDVEGGVSHIYVAPLSEVSAGIVVNNEVTDFTMATPSQWIKMQPDDDDTARYDQTGERNGQVLRISQELFIKYGGLGLVNVNWANTLSKCCALAVIVCYNSGDRVLQGMDFLNDSLVKSKTAARFTPSSLSDTGENEGRIEGTITSIGRHLSLNVALDDDAIELL